MKLKIHLIAGSPGASQTVASVNGDILEVDGVAYDLSAIEEGDEAIMEGDHPFIGQITRQDGELCAAIVWRYDGSIAARDQGDRHPEISVTTGQVPSPVILLALEAGA